MVQVLVGLLGVRSAASTIQGTFVCRCAEADDCFVAGCDDE